MILELEQVDLVCGNLLESAEKLLLDRIMQVCKYNQSRAAKQLGISRGTLRTKLNKYFANKYFKNTNNF